MPEEKWSVHLACSPREPSMRLLLLMGIWHMLLLHLLLCCCSGTYCCSHIICSWSVFDICQNPRTHASFTVVEWKQIHFLPCEKMCPCTRIIEYCTLCHHKQILGRTLKSDLDWHQGLIDWSFSSDHDGFWIRPHQRNWNTFKWSLVNNKAISKVAATIHVQPCLSQASSFSGDKTVEKKIRNEAGKHSVTIAQSIQPKFKNYLQSVLSSPKVIAVAI